jgi:hypothetical protein
VLSWINSSKLVKLQKDSVQYLRKYDDDDDGRDDYTSISTRICNELFQGHDLSMDVHEWLNLMMEDP